MRTLEFTVPPEYDGRKVLHYLRGAAGCSASLVKSLKTQTDGILLNGVRTRTIDRLAAGDRIAITLRDAPGEAQFCDERVPILLEDEDLVVYNKPAGMACHPVRGLQQGTLANVFARDCAERGVPLTCRLMGRLDRDTSGAVVIAKNARAASLLAGRVEKTYLAAATGAPSPLEGTVDAPIGRPDPFSSMRVVMEGGQQALTDYAVLALRDGYSIVRCTLRTGRTHQIRVHLASVGCPLLGDALYGGDGALIERHALHCARAAFVHPVTGERITVAAPIPQDMQKLLPEFMQSW